MHGQTRGALVTNPVCRCDTAVRETSRSLAASAMIALVFLYFTALIFIYGGELNAAIARQREIAAKTPERVTRRGRAPSAAPR